MHGHGGPEVLRWEEIELPEPAPDEVRVRQTAIGINYSDINVRRGGFYLGHAPPFPLIPGNEAAGEVESIGAGVTDIKPGSRTCWFEGHSRNAGDLPQEQRHEG